MPACFTDIAMIAWQTTTTGELPTVFRNHV